MGGNNEERTFQALLSLSVGIALAYEIYFPSSSRRYLSVWVGKLSGMMGMEHMRKHKIVLLAAADHDLP